MDRHGRQDRLAEIGSQGQARIAAATADVRLVGLAGEVATRYLAGAGVGRLRVREAGLVAVARAVDPAVRVEVVDAGADSNAGAHSGAGDFAFRDAAAAALALGAREALRVLRGILEVGS
jgi:hypothetical protein